MICHARGGSVARGGSRIDALVQAAPRESITGVLRLTEQGETISQSYGLRPNALRTLERAFGALGTATRATRRGQVGPEPAAARECVQWTAQRSREAWSELMVADRAFGDFFRSITPIDVIERMQVGSRSIWESAATESTALAVRSTPWVFAWSQTRYFAPGWYGAGTALSEAIGRFGVAALRAASRDWPFFQLLLADIEAQLARVDLDIAEHYVDLGEPDAASLRAAAARRTRALLQRGARDQRSRRTARLGPHAAAGDPAAQPYVDPDEPDAGGPAAPMARHGPRGRGPFPGTACQRQRHRAGSPDDGVRPRACGGI